MPTNLWRIGPCSLDTFLQAQSSKDNQANRRHSSAEEGTCGSTGRDDRGCGRGGPVARAAAGGGGSGRVSRGPSQCLGKTFHH
ncbi:hypothetical protein N658DRAFT_498466 [Parathielavia hyrcaniae]|uniref:Uncharacterized protein n=1 Tax=Parathielavia hyrcaniae TaxID=113614 RepID=A0AAN6Q1K6_9PEZI|nr:hypothetical protein N658DRAFT_498466 [Parathielavia hyrcaniae]